MTPSQATGGDQCKRRELRAQLQCDTSWKGRLTMCKAAASRQGAKRKHPERGQLGTKSAQQSAMQRGRTQGNLCSKPPDAQAGRRFQHEAEVGEGAAKQPSQTQWPKEGKAQAHKTRARAAGHEVPQSPHHPGQEARRCHQSQGRAGRHTQGKGGKGKGRKCVPGPYPASQVERVTSWPCRIGITLGPTHR